MTWATPKTDWDTDDGIGDADLNRIETNILEMFVEIDAGTNGRMGLATFTTQSSVTVNNTSVTANTRILLSLNSTPTGGAPILYISAITPGVSFVISVYSGEAISATVAYLLLDSR
jgi:hypothetical protein